MQPTATSLQLPRPSRADFESRWRRLQERMEESGVDLLVVYGDDHAVFGPANARYLTDFPVHFEPCLVLLGRDGAPVLATGPETVGHAELVSAVDRCVAITEFTVPGIVYPGQTFAPLSEVLASLGSPAPSRVAIAGLDQLPVLVWRRIRACLGEDEPLPFDDVLLELRARKSEEELKVLRHAAALTEIGFGALLETCRPGAREYEVAAAAEQAIRSRGAEGTAIDTIVASGRENSAPIIGRTGERELAAGDWIAVTFATRYHGYSAPIGRVISLGSPPEALAAAVDAAEEAQRRVVAQLRPGVSFEAVDAPARKLLEERGLVRAYGSGHSVGVQEFESPFAMPGAPGVVEEGMVMSIDIGLFDGPWGGFRIEDAFVVGPALPEPMTGVQPGLIEVA
jgi:Xaa-Pro aminopeptidase